MAKKKGRINRYKSSKSRIQKAKKISVVKRNIPKAKKIAKAIPLDPQLQRYEEFKRARRNMQKQGAKFKALPSFEQYKAWENITGIHPAKDMATATIRYTAKSYKAMKETLANTPFADYMTDRKNPESPDIISDRFENADYLKRMAWRMHDYLASLDDESRDDILEAMYA